MNESSELDDYQWEILPSRKRTKSNNNSSKNDIVVKNTTTTTNNNNNTKAIRPQVAQHQQIMDNIELRRTILKAKSTLASKDGCSGTNYEYLDHTADVQCHAWGATIPEAFENMVPCMMNYMTDITLVSIDPEETIEIVVDGHDNYSLLYNFMTEILFRFGTDCFCPVKAEIISFIQDSIVVHAKQKQDDTNADDTNPFVVSKGTRHDRNSPLPYQVQCRLFGDIFDPTKHTSGTEIKAITYSNMQIHNGNNRVDLFVIVDI